MGFGLVNDDAFLNELESLNKKANEANKAEIINMPSRGRKEGDNNVPDALRRVIAENAIEEGNKETKEMTRAFGISDSSLSAYKNGATSTTSYDRPNQSLKHTVDTTKERISVRAKGRILKAISHITDEKMQGTKAVDLASIARNLSAVVKNIEPDKSITPQGNGPTFIIYTPPMKREEHFDTIVLDEYKG